MSYFKVKEDTICAISTARGVGGLSVIRVSGPQSKAIVSKLCSFLPSSCDSHKIYYGFIKGLDKKEIDEVLVSYFATGRSFTGEETIEISSHGGNFISQSIIIELQKSGARIAERGEFTYRSFINGRIDLPQAEAVLTMIESESHTSSQLALKQLKGHLSETFKSMEERLTSLLAHLEADIDFASEDIEYRSGRALLPEALKLQSELKETLSTYKKGRQIKEGVYISIIGEPNVGKSSLFNSILGEDRAIVSSQEGTTRDYVEASLFIDGISYYFRDTAGLRDTKDEIEKLGMERSLGSARESDLIFFTFDFRHPLSKSLKDILVENSLEKIYFLFNKSDLVPTEDHLLLFKGKVKEISDILSVEDVNRIEERSFLVSALKGQGLKSVLKFLGAFSVSRWAEDSAIVLQARHFELLNESHKRLSAAIDLLQKEMSSEFIAFELQDSLTSIQKLLGREYNDEVMDKVFKEFCLGK